MIAIILIAAACMLVFFVQRRQHESAIHKKIESIGGQVVSFEHHLTSYGSPFWFVGKGETIYKIYYTYEGIEQVGWVKFGLFPNWKL